MKTKLTIVTTTYNQEKYIGQAIDGMLMQKTNFPFKIVISNDCSTDKTGEILEKYRKENPDVIHIIDNKNNLGAMGNFINTLSQIKDTEYVALCDGDDFWTDENKLQKQVEFLDNNKDYSICCHKAKLFYQNGEKNDEIIPACHIEETTTIDDLVVQNYIVANSVVYRWGLNDKDLKAIFPDNIVPGDYYIHLIHAQNGKIKMFEDVMSAYRRHEDGMWWSNDSENKENFTLKYGRKFLNFYNAADKFIKLPENAFYAQRKDIIYNIIVTYVKNDKINEMTEQFVSQKDKQLYEECMKDIVDRNIAYIDIWAKNDRKFIKRVKRKLGRIKNSILSKIKRK